ncbi:MAG: hypothetical protein RLZ35_844 [Pseudomonadota bacterium]
MHEDITRDLNPGSELNYPLPQEIEQALLPKIRNVLRAINNFCTITGHASLSLQAKRIEAEMMFFTYRTREKTLPALGYLVLATLYAAAKFFTDLALKAKAYVRDTQVPNPEYESDKSQFPTIGYRTKKSLR